MSDAPRAARSTSSGWGSVCAVAVTAAIGVLVWHDWQSAWFAAGKGHRVVVKLMLYWSLWLLWPAMGWLAWSAWQFARARRLAAASGALLVLTASGCVAWARFIEPNLLQVRETTLGSSCGVRVALVSDLHIGLFTREPQLERLVDRLNTLNVDAVLVAGDWTFEPTHDLTSTFAPLAKLRHRTLSVLGNHEQEHPGPPLREPLALALAAAHVEAIDSRRVPLGRCELEGLGDVSVGLARSDLNALQTQPSAVAGDHRIVLAHNPDTVFLLPPGHAAWLLAGHTHGGQIDLPFLTDWLLPKVTAGNFRQGVYDMDNAHVFVTPGIGMDKLPMRFRVPPTIDVLTF